MEKQRSPKEPPERLSFEVAIEHLEEIVHQLEGGQLGLDDALGRYEEGVQLLRRCYDLLNSAERRIELLSGVDAEGRPICTPLEQAPATFDGGASPGRGPKHAPTSSPERGGSNANHTDVDASGRLF